MTIRALILGAAAFGLAACGDSATVTDIDAEPKTSSKASSETTDNAVAIPNELTGIQAENAAWLEENSKKRGMTVSGSGLQYVVVQKGLKDGAVAGPGQGMAAHYHGIFRDGSKFDSSYDRGQPLRGPSNGFISGWNEVLTEMKVCEARTLYIKPELAYGSRDRGQIPANSILIFHMQLLEVQKSSDEDPGVYKCPEDQILSGPEAY